MKVSVIIPTVGRPELSRALSSVLDQNFAVLEIIVVADTIEPVQIPSEVDVQLLRVGPGAGGNAARQAGIRRAQGDIIALLDDDDQWLPDHLSDLISLISESSASTHNWIATSRVLATRENGSQEVWPLRLKAPGEQLEHYLFRKTSVAGGVGFIQASSLVFPRALALEIPFDESLKFHQDIGWLLECANRLNPLHIIQSAKPTTLYHVSNGSVSNRIKWKGSLRWALQSIDPSDQRTLGDFILVQVIQGAKNSGSLRDMIAVIASGIFIARPGRHAVAYALLLTVQTAVKRVATVFSFRGQNAR